MEKWVFLLFLFIAAGQDIRKKSVAASVFGVFGALAALTLGYGWWFLDRPVDWGSVCCSLCLGLGLLGCSMLSDGAVGAGDGCFFLVSAWLLEFWDNLALLCYGLIFCGIFCMGLLIWNQVHLGRNIGRQTVPFLPFLVPIGLWIVCRA